MALTNEIARQQQPVTAVQVRRTRKRKVLGSKAAYAYVAPFFVVFAAFSLYPWLAKLRFRGSGFLLAFTIGTTMAPTQMGIIPLYMLMVPAARPAMAVLGMLTFLTAWNDFFWPIIALNMQNRTVQVAFQGLAKGYAPQQSIIMAGTLYGIVPVLIVFALLGRRIVGGIMQGAIKG
jgi:ABC-type glycerol-3-phosphate transport system permease component